MEGCTVTPLHDYILKTEKLLDLERGEELDVISSTLTSRTLPELVASGSALSKLHVINVRTGMGHRKIVKFVKKVQEPYIPLPSHKFGSGDTVGISYSTNHEEYLCEGVVTKTTDVSLSVAVEHWDRDSIDVDSKTFCVLPTANDVTYKRMKSCLDALKEHKSKIGFALVEYLFGDRVIPFASSSPKPITSFFDTNLNSIQQEAVKRSTNNYRPIFVIHGPPGTGKTRTIVEVIRQAVEMGQKVLVCAPSNVAVDNIVERIGPYVKLIRIGHPARSHPSCAQYTLDSRLMHSDHAQVIKDIRNEMDSCVKSSKWRDLKDLRKELNSRENQATKQLLSSADVICSTLTSASVYGALRAIKDRGFDLVVVDECAQATELACWIPLLQSKRCILAGDHKQLPPTVISEEAAKQGFSQSLMERMEKEFSSIYSNELFIMLNVQYRMNENIMTWASNQMYYGKLIADQSVKDHSLRELLPCIDEITGSVLRFIDTDGCDMQEIVTSDSDSKGNVGEVKLVYILVKELIDCGCKQEFISIISPYNLQVNLLRQHVGSVYPHVTIRSVDGFQGQENEIMVLSLVRSNDKGEVGFLKDTRRMNVAVTRARRQLVIVGDSSTISKDVFIKSLVEHIELNGIINHANEFQDLETEDTSANNKIREEMDNIVEEFCACGLQNLSLDPNLNSYERMIVHEIAESRGLAHNSIGEGGERRIVLMKLPAVLEPTTIAGTNHQCCNQPALLEQTTSAGTNQQFWNETAVLEPTTSVGEKPTNQVQKSENLEKPAKKKKGKKEKGVVVDGMQSKIKEASDDDALLDMVIADRSKCRFSQCKTSVAVLGQFCQHCKGTFCLNHSMPEIHGCGNAARSIARKEYMSIVGGVLKPQKTPKYNAKQKELQAKLDKKMQDMQKDRKTKTK